MSAEEVHEEEEEQRDRNVLLYVRLVAVNMEAVNDPLSILYECFAAAA